ncbi:MAG: NAD+ synthase [Candidatus Levyibacteriota bacterium]
MSNIDYQKEIEKISSWILQEVRSAGFEKVVIGVSGGVDSAASLSLAVKALRKDMIFPILMPYGNTQAEGFSHAKEIIQLLEIPQEHVFVFDIKKIVDVIIEDLGDVDKVRKGNVMARVRMLYLFDRAKKENALVVGTENKSEKYLGYFTRFGDEASDIEPIQHLYKTQIWEMAKVLQVPEDIISKAPTAGLWEGQTDEEEFGFSYVDADKILYYFFDEKLSEDAILAKGLDGEVVGKVLKRVKENNFKQNLPKTIS